MKKKKGSMGVKIDGNVGGHVAIGDNIKIYGNYQPTVSLHQLPSPPADFVGREEALAQLLQQERSAISGLSGLGGVGKTALGLVAAHELAKTYSDAQFFLDLRGSSQNPLTPSEAMRQVILSFDLTADLRQYNDGQLKSLYNSLLNGKHALLFFDNAHDATQVRPLLPPPGCCVLITSRTHFTLPGMSAPIRLGELLETEAIALITKITPRAEKYAAEIAKLCSKLPLALRIAATFLAEHPDWTPAEYIEKLQKQRLQTLKSEGDPAQDVEAVFELSYAQLSTEEQKQWQALSVFTAPFTRLALAAVANLDEAAARELAGKLNRMSLLEFNAETKKYFVHNLLRDFAVTHLNGQEDFNARIRHVKFFMSVIREADTLYKQGHNNVLHGLALFDNEWAHIEAAQVWAGQNIKNGTAELAMCLPDIGIHCINLRLSPLQRINWLEYALYAARFLKHKVAEGIHLTNLGLAYSDLGEMNRAIKFQKQALEINREIGDKHLEGQNLANQGNIYLLLGETHRAIEFYEQALAIKLQIGDKRDEGAFLSNLGIAYQNLGEIHRAIEFYEQALVINRQIGDKRSEGQTLGNLGIAYQKLGAPRRALEFHEQALAIDRQLGDKRGEGQDLANLGIAYRALGAPHRAIEFHEQALAIDRQLGDKYGEGQDLGNLGLAYTDLGETNRAIDFYEQSLAIKRIVNDKHGEGNAQFNMGLAYQKLGDLTRARQLGQHALEIFASFEDPIIEKVRKWLGSLPKNEE